MTSKQRSKNAFIKRAKNNFDLSGQQAKWLYRAWSDKYGGLVRAADLGKHPIVAKRFAAESVHRTTAGIGKRADVGKVVSGQRSLGTKGLQKIRSVRTVADWDDVYDSYDYDPVEYESSADYGEVT